MLDFDSPSLCFYFIIGALRHTKNEGVDLMPNPTK
ncbi:MAG: hypothetical protein ACD_69C00142G0001, partial [uncultured bacterium]